MESYNLLCVELSAIIPGARDLCIANANLTSAQLEQLINSFMGFCTANPGHVMLNSRIIWEFLYVISDIIKRHNYKFKFQDKVHYDERAGHQVQVFDEVSRVPLDVLPTIE